MSGQSLAFSAPQQTCRDAQNTVVLLPLSIVSWVYVAHSQGLDIKLSRMKTLIVFDLFVEEMQRK